MPNNGPSSQFEVVVVGAGQAGLAIGYFLAQQGREFAILEAAERACGDVARSAGTRSSCSRRLATDGLPGLAFPGDPDSYPTRDEVVVYLTDYARPLRLAGRAGQPRPVDPAGRGAGTGSSSTTGLTRPIRS